MADIPQDLRYTREHEYVKDADEDGVYLVGITDYAQGELGDIVFVELPAVGERFDAGQTFGNIEAVKAVSDLFCPVEGEIVAVNESLEANPGVINSDPYGEGWMVRIRAADPSAVGELLDADAYRELIGG